MEGSRFLEGCSPRTLPEPNPFARLPAYYREMLLWAAGTVAVGLLALVGGQAAWHWPARGSHHQAQASIPPMPPGLAPQSEAGASRSQQDATGNGNAARDETSPGMPRDANVNDQRQPQNVAAPASGTPPLQPRGAASAGPPWPNRSAPVPLDPGETWVAWRALAARVECPTVTPTLDLVAAYVPAEESVTVWRVADAAPVGSFSTDGLKVRCLALARDGKWLASGSEDGTVHLMSLETRSRQALPDKHPSVVRLAFHPDSATLASGGLDGTVRLWSTQGGGTPGHVLRSQGSPTALRLQRGWPLAARRRRPGEFVAGAAIGQAHLPATGGERPRRERGSAYAGRRHALLCGQLARQRLGSAAGSDAPLNPRPGPVRHRGGMQLGRTAGRVGRFWPHRSGAYARGRR